MAIIDCDHDEARTRVAVGSRLTAIMGWRRRLGGHDGPANGGIDDHMWQRVPAPPGAVIPHNLGVRKITD